MVPASETLCCRWTDVQRSLSQKSDDLITSFLLTFVCHALPRAQSSQVLTFPVSIIPSAFAIAWVMDSDSWPNALWNAFISLTITPFPFKDFFLCIFPSWRRIHCYSQFYENHLQYAAQSAYHLGRCPHLHVHLHGQLSMFYLEKYYPHTPNHYKLWFSCHTLSLLFFSSLLSLPLFHRADISENKFIFACLLYLTGSSVYCITWQYTCLIITSFLPLIVALIDPLSASITSFKCSAA